MITAAMRTNKRGLPENKAELMNVHHLYLVHAASGDSSHCQSQLKRKSPQDSCRCKVDQFQTLQWTSAQAYVTVMQNIRIIRTVKSKELDPFFLAPTKRAVVVDCIEDPTRIRQVFGHRTSTFAAIYADANLEKDCKVMHSRIQWGQTSYKLIVITRIFHIHVENDVFIVSKKIYSQTDLTSFRISLENQEPAQTCPSANLTDKCQRRIPLEQLRTSIRESLICSHFHA